jgi:hypothetical protein
LLALVVQGHGGPHLLGFIQQHSSLAQRSRRCAQAHLDQFGLYLARQIGFGTLTGFQLLLVLHHDPVCVVEALLASGALLVGTEQRDEPSQGQQASEHRQGRADGHIAERTAIAPHDEKWHAQKEQYRGHDDEEGRLHRALRTGPAAVAGGVVGFQQRLIHRRG